MRASPKISPRRRSLKAVSLVAFLTAVLILSFVLIPFYLAFQSQRTGTVRSLNSIIASNVAASLIEEYKAKSFLELESLLLGISPPPEEGISPAMLNGPFDKYPPEPDLELRQVQQSGTTVFDAEIYLSYFPDPNPDPDSADFDLMRQRIRIEVRVQWQDIQNGRVYRDQEFALATIVHNERFSAKPSLRRLTTTDQGGDE